MVGPFYWVTPAPQHWPLILMQATLARSATSAWSAPSPSAPAVVIQPFTYTLLLYEIGIGFLLFGDVPDGADAARCGDRGGGGRLRCGADAQAGGGGAGRGAAVRLA